MMRGQHSWKMANEEGMTQRPKGLFLLESHEEGKVWGTWISDAENITSTGLGGKIIVEGLRKANGTATWYLLRGLCTLSSLAYRALGVPEMVLDIAKS